MALTYTYLGTGFVMDDKAFFWESLVSTHRVVALALHRPQAMGCLPVRVAVRISAMQEHKRP